MSSNQPKNISPGRHVNSRSASSPSARSSTNSIGSYETPPPTSLPLDGSDSNSVRLLQCIAKASTFPPLRDRLMHPSSPVRFTSKGHRRQGKQHWAGRTILRALAGVHNAPADLKVAKSAAVEGVPPERPDNGYRSESDGRW